MAKKYAVKLKSNNETLRVFTDKSIADAYLDQVKSIGKRPAYMKVLD